MIVVRRLAPGDEQLVAEPAELEPPDADLLVITNSSNEAAMALYESVGGMRPNDDDVMWDFGYEAR